MLTALNLRVELKESFDPRVWRLPVKHLSASSLRLAATCPEAWRRKYILHEKDTTTTNLILGSAVHKALERNFRAKIDSGADIQMDDIGDLYELAWNDTVNRQKDAIDWGKDDPAEVREKGLGLVDLYLRDVAPRINPLSVEERINVQVPGLPVPLLGFIDLVDADRGMVDYKTSSRKVEQAKPDWLVQGRIYQIAKPMPFSWHVIVKTKTPQIFTPLEANGLYEPYSEVAVAHVKRYVRDLGWSLNALYQTHPDSPWPTTGVVADGACKRCPYLANCPAWKR